MAHPTFLIIGAQKCGTTWIANILRLHPEVFIPRRKELHFFDKRRTYGKGIDWYRRQFTGCSGQKAVGEGTPNYFWTSEDPREIEADRRNTDIPRLVHRHFPSIRLILTLRDPVNRAVSAYYHHLRARRVSPNSSISDVYDDHGIVTMGYYATHLEKWYEVFPREQILVLLYETDICANRERTCRRIFRFLGVDESFVPDRSAMEARYNPRSTHFYVRLHYYLPSLSRVLKKCRLVSTTWDRNLWPIPVRDEEKAELARLYAGPNERLATLLGRDLPWSQTGHPPNHRPA